jgi:putative hydrolase of HD superfamily
MQDLQSLLRFVELTHQFQNVERVVYAGVGKDKCENDAEHSYQTAITAWYLNDAYQLSFNTEKILKYALVHDLVEAYAGDTSIHDKDAHIGKHEREEKALQQIIKTFPEATDIYETIKMYERLEDNESKFVYALDKLLPMINSYLDNGRSWHKNNVSYKVVQEYKQPKVALDPTIHKLYNELINLLEKKVSIFFPRP